MEALNRVLNEIRMASTEAGREVPPSVIAVSKFQPIGKMIEAHAQGQRIFGENYVQELVTKKHLLEGMGYSDFEFHFIGKLQTNKVKQVLPLVKAIHSVDSLRLLNEIEKRARDLAVRPEVYFQVNIDEEETKGGFLVSELEELSESVKACKSVIPAGLMTIPDPSRDVEVSFSGMKALSNRFGNVLGHGLSMGMSGDYVSAIRHGATIVRIGSALFGKRE